MTQKDVDLQKHIKVNKLIRIILKKKLKITSSPAPTSNTHMLFNYSLLFKTLFFLGLSSFYSELMKGIGASGRLWQLIDRNPTIPLSGKNNNYWTFCKPLQLNLSLQTPLYYGPFVPKKFSLICLKKKKTLYNMDPL